MRRRQPRLQARPVRDVQPLARQHHQLVAGVEAFNAHRAGAVGEEGRVAEFAPRELPDKGLLCGLGSAAGVAAAFNAPLGGILYSFEEVRPPPTSLL